MKRTILNAALAVSVALALVFSAGGCFYDHGHDDRDHDHDQVRHDDDRHDDDHHEGVHIDANVH